MPDTLYLLQANVRPTTWRLSTFDRTIGAGAKHGSGSEQRTCVAYTALGGTNTGSGECQKFQMTRGHTTLCRQVAPFVPSPSAQPAEEGEVQDTSEAAEIESSATTTAVSVVPSNDRRRLREQFMLSKGIKRG